MKQIALTVISLLLAAICIFCSVFSIVMASRPDLPDTQEENDSDKSPAHDSGKNNDTENDPTGDNTDEDPSDNDDNTPKKKVAITLDDGPYAAYQKKFIDEMKKYGGAATFFIVGNRVQWSSETGPGLAYAVDNGWEIGIHAWTHEKDKFFDICSDEVYNFEIQSTVNIIQKYVPGYDVRLMRPPGGQITSARASASPYAIIRWDVDSYDYNYQSTASGKKEANVQAIIDNVMAQVREGSIILMHELYENSFDAYCEVLRLLDAQGYEFVTVSELLGDKYQAGKTFTSGR